MSCPSKVLSVFLSLLCGDDDDDYDGYGEDRDEGDDGNGGDDSDDGDGDGDGDSDDGGDDGCGGGSHAVGNSVHTLYVAEWNMIDPAHQSGYPLV